MMNAIDIQQEYERRLLNAPELRWGWSFMYVPEARLRTANVALVGLNPGGSQLDPVNEWDYAAGENAYLDESWRGLVAGEHHLQQQVRSLFDAMGVTGGDVFAANLVPFRSPSWTALPDRDGALNFGRSLWRSVLAESPARLFVSLGKQPGKEIAALLNARWGESLAADWGSQTIDVYRAVDGRTVVALPHLSRFKIFGGSRTMARDHLRDISQAMG